VFEIGLPRFKYGIPVGAVLSIATRCVALDRALGPLDCENRAVGDGLSSLTGPATYSTGCTENF
jgi:hypothetical protein